MTNKPIFYITENALKKQEKAGTFVFKKEKTSCYSLQLTVISIPYISVTVNSSEL